MSVDKKDVHYQRAPCPESSCMSMKSEISLTKFSDEAVTSDTRMRQTATSPVSSCVSMKSNSSICQPPDLSNGTVISNDRMRQSGAPFVSSCVSMKSNESVGQPPNLCNATVTSDPVDEYSDLLKSVNHLTTSLVETNIFHQRIKDTHKTWMKSKYESLFEGIVHKNQTLLNRIYTQLYITEGESEGVNEEHEIVEMEKNPRTQLSQDTPIYCYEIFKPLRHSGCEGKAKIKAVLTKGIAGIGKTVSVQKYILDWAEGKANQDVDFMFVLPFRELNLIKDHQYSLHRLLLDFYPELHDLDSEIYEECIVVFIFDGLDESRIAMEFLDTEKVSDVNEISSVSVLLANLIKGDLLSSSHIWITSRPAAAKQIPSKYIDRLTEIQGFNESQKEEYFKKRISDEHQASRIISHIKRSRSLYIMCHIPVFCWISATVLQNHLKHSDSAEIPQTLTEMYIHFLLIQRNIKNQKYEEKDPEKLLKSNREMIVKLAELAFRQLMKGNVMFYEKDLIESGIDVTDASVYSGICTEIFKEEYVIHQRKVYSFIHLSFQEFFAAFYVFHSYIVSNVQALKPHFLRVERFRCWKMSLSELLQSVVDKTLLSKTGHLDIYLRFLLGISMESNQRLLQGLLTHTENSSEIIRNTTQYIKYTIRANDNFSANRSINLLHCLLEVNDLTFYKEIQDFVKSDRHSENKLSPAYCTAIAYMVQMSEEVLDELDLKKYNTTNESRRRLLPAVSNCRKAILSGCNLTDACYKTVASVLQSPISPLRELDLRNNILQIWKNLHYGEGRLAVLQNLNSSSQNYGVEMLFVGLSSSQCKLEKLRLGNCSLTDQSCKSLASALQSSNASLRDLDLSNNDLKDSGVKLLCAGLKSLNCVLETLRYLDCKKDSEIKI